MANLINEVKGGAERKCCNLIPSPDFQFQDSLSLSLSPSFLNWVSRERQEGAVVYMKETRVARASIRYAFLFVDILSSSSALICQRLFTFAL